MASVNREIVTIQAGHYANHVATHWWNLQEASFVYDEFAVTNVNHDVLFREGRTRQGELTYLPRTIAIDLKGSLNTLSSEGNLYKHGQKSHQIAWKGEVSLHKEEAQSKNEYLEDLDKESADDNQGNGCSNYSVLPSKSNCETGAIVSGNQTKFYNLDESIKVWSDFMHMDLHPRSLHIIKEYVHDSEVDTFDAFNVGSELWRNQETAEAIEDKVRYFAEECDYLQGFQMLVDGNDGFAGLGSEIISHLEEEYSRKNILVLPVIPTICKNAAHSPKHNCLLNLAYLLHKSSTSSLTVPLSLKTKFACTSEERRKFRHLDYKNALDYHTSAILAAGLEGFTMTYRVKDNPFSLRDFIGSLTGFGMRIGSASLGFPFYGHQPDLAHMFSEMDASPFIESLSPNVDFPTKDIAFQTFGMRGLLDIPLVTSSTTASLQNPYQRCRNIEEMIATYINRISSNSLAIKAVQDYCKISAPFPNIFSLDVSNRGTLSSRERLFDTSVSQIPLLSGVHSHAAIGNAIQDLCRTLSKGRRHTSGMCGWTFTEKEEFQETIENLWSLSLNYHSVDNKEFEFQ